VYTFEPARSVAYALCDRPLKVCSQRNFFPRVGFFLKLYMFFREGSSCSPL
jgi:hypothetical protein